jgi:hypothetical protein
VVTRLAFVSGHGSRDKIVALEGIHTDENERPPAHACAGAAGKDRT